MENKKVIWISEVTQYFQTYFTDYQRDTRALQKNLLGDREFTHNLVFLFKMENGLYGESENIEDLWHYVTDFLRLSPYVGKNNELLNKEYWDDLDIID